MCARNNAQLLSSADNADYYAIFTNVRPGKMERLRAASLSFVTVADSTDSHRMLACMRGSGDANRRKMGRKPNGNALDNIRVGRDLANDGISASSKSGAHFLQATGDVGEQIRRLRGVELASY